jgi:hypothetical protein
MSCVGVPKPAPLHDRTKETPFVFVVTSEFALEESVIKLTVVIIPTVLGEESSVTDYAERDGLSRIFSESYVLLSGFREH